MWRLHTHVLNQVIIKFSIKFNDEHIPDSPFNVFDCFLHLVMRKKLTIHSLKTKRIRSEQKLVHLLFNVNGARGRLDARVIAPSGAEDILFQYKKYPKIIILFDFIPKEKWYSLDFMFDSMDEIFQNHLFRIFVGQSNADPGRVSAAG